MYIHCTYVARVIFESICAYIRITSCGRFPLPGKVVEEWNCTPVDVLDKRNLVLSHHAGGSLCQ